MNGEWNQIFDRISSLIRKRSYNEALPILQATNPQDLKSNKDIAQYHYSIALCYRGIGNFKDGLIAIKPAMELTSFDDDREFYTDQIHLYARLLLGNGDIHDAFKYCTQAYSLRSINNEIEKLWTSLILLAECFFLKGDLLEALRWAEDAVNSAKDHNTKDELFICDTNRLRILLFLGEFEEAEPILLQYNQNDSMTPPDKAFILQSLGILSMHRLDHLIASEYLMKAYDIYANNIMHREKLVCIEYLGLNDYLSGAYDSAIDRFTSILNHYNPRPHPSAEAQTLRLLAETYIAISEFEKAEDTADKALEMSKTIKEQIERGALYRIYGKIYAYRDKRDRSKRSFEKSESILIKTGAQYELALTYIACSQSCVFGSDMRLNYLEKAKELFIKIGVPEWLTRLRKYEVVPAAEDLLESHWSHEAIPVDPYAIAKALRIDVMSITTEEAVAGGIWHKQGRNPIIFLNNKDHLNKRRFTCAHELGHYIFPPPQVSANNDFELTDYKTVRKSEDGADIERLNEMEVVADRFAATLLMPEKEVRKILRELRVEYRNDMRNISTALCNHFSVSPEVVQIRLDILGLAQRPI